MGHVNVTVFGNEYTRVICDAKVQAQRLASFWVVHCNGLLFPTCTRRPIRTSKETDDNQPEQDMPTYHSGKDLRPPGHFLLVRSAVAAWVIAFISLMISALQSLA